MRILLIALLALLPLTAAAEGFSEEELLEAVKTYAPQRYEKLISLKDTDPDAYEDALEVVSQKLLERKMAQSEHKAQQEVLKARFMELAVQHADASKRQQEALRVEMEALANQYFEVQMEAKRLRLEAIQAKVERMEAQLERREERRDEIINRYIDAALQAEDAGTE